MRTHSTGKQKNRIKDLPLNSRPREKLLNKGAQNLTDAELIAILFGTGSTKQNVISLASTVLSQYPLEKLASVSSAHLEKISGIGKVKALHILAALELGKRVFDTSVAKTTIYTTQDALAICRDITGKKQEYMLVLYLNARHELIQKETIGIGNLNTLVIEPKEIFSPALLSPCAEIIIVHNHPSGDPTPSEEDIHFTQRVQNAGEIMGVSLIDHLILSTSGYFSFREDDYVKESSA